MTPEQRDETKGAQTVGADHSAPSALCAPHERGLWDYKFAFGKLKDRRGWALIRILPDKTVEEFGPWKTQREMKDDWADGTYVDRPVAPTTLAIAPAKERA